MGHPYDILIAPAILLNNPGVSREQFSSLLDKTYAKDSPYQPNDELTKIYEKALIKRFHNGLDGLAGLLNLKEITYKYPKLPKDEFGQAYGGVEKDFKIENGRLFYTVIRHLGNKYHQPTKIYDWVFNKLKIGQYFQVEGLFEEYIIKKIIKEELIAPKEIIDCDSYDYYYYELEVIPFEKEIIVYEYDSEPELYKDWPQFSPEVAFDWSQEEGTFKTDSIMDKKEAFRWFMKQGKYYFHPISFDLMSEGFTKVNKQLGYTDLILTQEAIKSGAWKVLSKNGDAYKNEFINTFSDARVNYEKAIIDAQFSIAAKVMGLTVAQFLRTHQKSIHNLSSLPEGYW